MYRPDPKVARDLRWLLLLPLCIVLSGSGFFSVSDIPSPLPEDLDYGEVIKVIQIEGNKETRTDVVLAAMKSKVGDTYTQELAIVDYKWLSQLGVFTSIRFETTKEDDGIVLLVDLAEVNKYMPAPVIRITDENGLSVGARVTSSNFLGGATKLSLGFTVGGATNIMLRLKDPWLPGRRWWFGYTLNYKHGERRNELYDFEERSDDVFFQMTRNITNQLRWGPQLEYLAIKSDVPDVTLSSDNRDHIPILGAFLEYDGRNLPIYPTRGWWGGLNVKKYGLGGVDTDYWAVDMDLRGYLELGSYSNSMTLYSLATLSSGEVGVNFPLYMQYNLGGANSVRGWSLGSRDGRNQFINTLEYWHVLMDHKKWKIWFIKAALGLQAGVFGDAGTAWSGGAEFRQNWIAGGGAGIRVLVPAIVMFRVDVAAGEEGLGVRFFVGALEKAVAQRMRVR